MDIKTYIRDIPDFPKPGIIFKDITPLLNDEKAFKATIDQLINEVSSDDYSVICGVESRGFIFGAAMALALGKRFVPIRKKNKLPAETYTVEYDLEYGSGILELHKDALSPDDKVVIVDDLLATGGTIKACEELVARSGAHVVSDLFVIELQFVNGRNLLSAPSIKTLLTY